MIPHQTAATAHKHTTGLDGPFKIVLNSHETLITVNFTKWSE